MATYNGLVGGNGERKGGSGSWQVTVRAKGKYMVTLNGASSMPTPVVSLNSTDLSSFENGILGFINVSDIQQDTDGNWFFGVILNDVDGKLMTNGFSFIAEA